MRWIVAGVLVVTAGSAGAVGIIGAGPREAPCKDLAGCISSGFQLRGVTSETHAERAPPRRLLRYFLQKEQVVIYCTRTEYPERDPKPNEIEYPDDADVCYPVVP